MPNAGRVRRRYRAANPVRAASRLLSHVLPITILCAPGYAQLAPTTTTITNVSPSPVQRSQNVTITATVAPVATGRVVFFSGARPIGSAVLSGGTAALTTNQLPSARNLLRATYAGDATHSASTTAIATALNVNAIPVGGNLFQQTVLTGLNDFFFIRVADMNGDGRSDLVAADINGHGITVALGNGDGTFQTPAVILTGSGTSSPRGLTIADFNLDGIPDIAVANGGDGTLSVLLGNGSGTSFTPSTQTPITVAAGNIIHDVLASDFNNDGFPDLVAADETGGQIAVYLGNGNGTFQSGVFFTGLGQPFTLVAEDFNGDGKFDLAVSSISPAQILIFLGNGLGTIFTPGTTLTGVTASGYIVAGDFTGDGKVDLAAGNNSQNLVLTYVGNGAGGFTASAGSPANVANLAAGDFNGDGILDVATAGNTGSSGADVHFGDSAGNFGTGSPVGAVPVNPQGIFIGDFNGDGRDDFVVGELSTTPATLFLGVGPPATVTTTAGSPQAVNVNTAFAPFQVVVKDSSGTPLGNTPVTFSAPASGASGVFAPAGTSSVVVNTNAAGIATSTTFTANNTAGSYNVSAAAGAITNTTAFAVTNLGPPATVTGTTQAAQILTAYSPSLQATVKDSAGSPLPGITVTFTAPASGASGTFAGTGTNTATANTNASGIATAPAFTANSTAGSYNVQAAAGAVTNTTAFSLTNNPGPPASVTTTAGNGQSTTILTPFGTALQVTVRDSSTNTISGVLVTFTAPASGASGTFTSTATNTSTATTNASGVASASVFTANSVAGTYNVSASAGAVNNATAFSLTNTAGAPASVTATAGTPQAAMVQTTFATALQATVRDSSGNAVPGIAVTFTAPVSGASGTFASGSNSVVAVTSATGVATASAFTANTRSGNYAVNATVTGVGSSGVFSLTNNPGPISSITVVAGGGQSTSINTTFPTAMQALVSDGFGNAIPGVGLTFAAPPTGPSGRFATTGTNTGSAITNAAGIATAPAFTANNIAGGYAVLASVASNVQAAAFDLVNNLGASSVSVSASSNPANLGQSATLTATVNPPNATGTVTFIFGTKVIGSAAVNAAGQASLTTSSLNAGMDFLRAQYSGDATITRAMSPPLAFTVRAGTTFPLVAAPAGPFAAGTNPKSVATGDFNGDGKIDLAVVNNGSNSVSVLLGNGDGSFQTAVNYSSDVSPVAIGAADLNGDGKIDLVVSNSGSSDVSVLLGNGDGTFQKAVNYAAGGAPTALSIVELNGDSKPDLVMTLGGASSAYSVLLGNGDGTFGVPTFQGPYQLQNWSASASNGGTTTISPSSGPANSASFSYSINLGNPGFGVSFRTWTFQTIAAGTGPISFQWHYTGFHAFFAVQARFQVFAGSAAGNNVITLYNPPQQNCCASPSAGFDVQGTATINVTQGFPFGFTVGGQNFDSNSQLNGTLTISNFSAPSAPNPVNLAGASGPVAIASGDFNGDGKADIAIANSLSNNITGLFGRGDGSFTTLGNFAAGSNPMGLVVADLNGDNLADVAVANGGSNNVSVLIGFGDGFNPAVNYAVGTGPSDIAISDFNGDGKSDLAVVNSIANTISVLAGNGNGTFQAASNYAAGSAPVGIAAADLNRDGHADIVVTNASGGNVMLGVGPPASIVATAGTPQTANVGAAFGNNLQASARDANGFVVAGATITFTAPTSGASGAFTGATTSANVVSDASGTATAPVFTANKIAGQYNVTAGATGATSAVFSLKNQGGLVTANPAGLNFSVTLPNTLSASQNIALTGSGPVDFTIATSTDDGATWLAASAPGNTTPATLTASLTSVALQLAPGTYNGKITITTTTDQTTIPVALTVVIPFDAPQSTLTFDYVIGAAPPPPQALQLTASGRVVPFTISASAQWLTLTPQSSKTPNAVAVIINPQGLGTNPQPGRQTATITITSPFASNSPLTVTVTLNVKAQLIAAPTSLSFTAIAGQTSPSPQVITVTGAQGLVFSATSSDAWLKAAVSPNTTPGAVTVSVDATALAPGDYTGTIQLVPANPQADGAKVQVTLKLRAPLSVSPATFTATTYIGIPSTPIQNVAVTSGGAPVSYSVTTTGETWLSVDSTSGKTPGTIKLTINPTGLTPGNYTSTVTVSSSQTVPASKDIPVTLTIPTPGTPQGLESSPLQVSTPPFSGPMTQSFTLVSSNQVPIPFKISTTGSFLTFSPTSGVTPALITETINTSALVPSTTYQASITITSLDTVITRDLKVAVQAPNPKLAISPPVLEVQAQAGKTGSNKFFIQNVGGGGALNFSVNIVNPQNTPFFTVRPPSGTLTGQNPAAIQVNVDATKLAAGPYYTTLIVTLGSLPPQQLPVSITVTPSDPVIALDFDGVQFDVRKGEGSSVSQDVAILNIGGKTFNWKAEILSGSEFLAITKVSGSVAPGTSGSLTLSTRKEFTNAPSTPTGTYFASLRISSPDAANSPKLFTAVLNLTDPAQVDATPVLRPTGLVFTAARGANPQSQNVQVFTSSQAPRAFQASTQTFTGPDIEAGAPVNWLSVKVNTSAASTGSPGSVDVTIQSAGLAPGVYTGGVSFSIGAVVRTVNVSLVVNSGTPAPKSSARRLDEAACVPTKLVPTFVGGLVNNFSQQVAGPVPVSVNVIDDCGNLVPNPSDPASPKADVTIMFSTGDPSAKNMLLTDAKRAAYTITWVPDVDATDTQVTVQARLGDLAGSAQSTGDGTAAAPEADGALIGGTAKVSGVVLPGTGPVLQTNATLNNLNPQRGAAVAPGAVVQIFGTNFTTADPASFQSLPLPGSLNGVTVLIGGLPAPLFYVAKGQINAQVPFELDPGRQYEIQVNVNGALTVPDRISIVPAAPGLAAAQDGSLLAQHTDGSLITPGNPAHPNEPIVIYLVGMGRTTPSVDSGAVSPADPLARVAVAPTVTLDGNPVNSILFAGLSPGFVGLYQINLVVPADIASGTPKLVVTQNAISSNAATLAVAPR